MGDLQIVSMQQCKKLSTESFSEEQTDEQREKMICPVCGGPTEWVKVLVQTPLLSV